MDLKKIDFGDELIERYNRAFEVRCWDNPHYAEATLHLIVGQLTKYMRIPIRQNYIDNRIHVILLQSSGTGKGRGFAFVGKLSEMIGLNYQPISQLTDASLVGTITPVNVFNKKTKSWQVEYITEEGLLSVEKGLDIYAMEEASVLFDCVNDYTQQAMNFFQQAMNPIGSVENRMVKKLAHGSPIETKSEVSVFMTTYEPENLYKTIVRRGFLQRMLILVRDVTLEEREKSTMKVISDMGGDGVGYMSDSDRDKDIVDLAKYFRYIAKKYKDVNTLKVDKDAGIHLIKIKESIYSPLYQVDLHPRRKLGEFTHRYWELALKIAYHHAILRLSESVEEEDFLYAYKLIMPIWENIIGLIEDGVRVPPGANIRREKYASDACEAYRMLSSREFKDNKRTYVLYDEMLEFLGRKVWNVSKMSASRRFKRILEEDYFEIKLLGHKPVVELVKRRRVK